MHASEKNHCMSVILWILVFLLCFSQKGTTQTVDQLIKNGRFELTKQTPAGLRNADQFFSQALKRNPDHEAANVLKTFTTLLQINRHSKTISSLDFLGISTLSSNYYNPEYAVKFDNFGRPVPSETATTQVIIDWARHVGVSEADESLRRLEKIRNEKFLLILSRREVPGQGNTLRVDFGDVHGMRFFLYMGKAIQALADTYNTDASFYTLYQMLRRGDLDLETFLPRYPIFLTRARADRREESKRFFLAAQKAYQTAADVIRQRDPNRPFEYLVAIHSGPSERKFENDLKALAKSFSSPQPFRGTQINLARAVKAKQSPRSLIGRVRGNAITPVTWPDRTLAGILPRGTASYLQKEANKITKSLNASYSTPQIISSGNAAGKVGKSFRYQIKSNNKVVNFTTSRLPQGLSLQNKGIISGSPKKAGTYSVKVTAKTNKGSATRVITIVVKK